MGKKPTSIPDRWINYLPLGKRLSGTRFIAFKVPLKQSFECRLAPDERFSPADLVNQVTAQKEELGLIIDLTYTTRYYDPEELPNTLQYCKIFTVGHEVPDKETILKFTTTVKKFLTENQHNDKLIGVHCTHGLNRTGYLVCRYLIDVEKMDPNVAIELFNRCRGHSIERSNYIEDLRSRYFRSELPSRRQRGRQNPHRSPQCTRNPNLITCYDYSQSLYNPPYARPTGSIQQRLGICARFNSRQFNLPYQQGFQGYGPSFPLLNRYCPLQKGRYNTDRPPNQNPFYQDNRNPFY